MTCNLTIKEVTDLKKETEKEIAVAAIKNIRRL